MLKLFRKAYGYVSQRLSVTTTDHWYDGGAKSDAGETVSQRSVLNLSTAWACVNLVAGTEASLPLVIYKPGPGGVWVEHTDHSLTRILRDSPNYDQTALDFWEFMAVALELRGNAYARKIKIDDRLVSLIPIIPELVHVRRDPGTRRLRYRWSYEGESFDLDQDDVFHIRGFGGDPLGGLSTLEYGRQTFGLASAVNKAASATFKNGMRPSGVLKFPKWLTDDQRALAKTTLVEDFIGSANAGRPFVAEGGVDWTALTMKPEDAQMLQSRAFSVEDICRFFSVPPFMVGHTEKSTSWGTGLEQQLLGFQKFTLRKRLRRIELAIRQQLMTAEDRAAGLHPEFDLDDLLRADSLARARVHEIYSRIGAELINEIRADLGRPPIPGGDVARMQMQNVPITDPGIDHNGGPPLEEAA